jgi:hypothetical protein
MSTSALACDKLLFRAALRHHVIRVDSACNLVVAQRTGESFRDLAALTECFDDCERALLGLNRAQHRLLLDVRLGPAHTGAEFERAFAEQRGKLLNGFARTAVLVSTAVGRLQMQRHAREDGREMFVSADVDLAFNYLQLSAHHLNN